MQQVFPVDRLLLLKPWLLAGRDLMRLKQTLQVEQQQLQPCVAQTVLWHFPPHLEMPLSLPTSLTLPEHALLLLAATDCHCQTHRHTDKHTRTLTHHVPCE